MRTAAEIPFLPVSPAPAADNVREPSIAKTAAAASLIVSSIFRGRRNKFIFSFRVHCFDWMCHEYETIRNHFNLTASQSLNCPREKHHYYLSIARRGLTDVNLLHWV
jgi:hypothetical protein